MKRALRGVLGVAVNGVALCLLLGMAGCMCTYEDSVPMPGEPSRFDPVKAYPQVAALAGRGAQLVELRSVRVRSDGTQDFTASYFKGFWGGSQYRFLRHATVTVDESLPVGVRAPGGKPQLQALEVEVLRPHYRSTSSQGGSFSTVWRGTGTHRGMLLKLGGSLDPKDVVPPPRCSFATLWATARKQGAPPDAVADIDYGRTGYGFRVAHTEVKLRFDHKCRLLRPGETAELPQATPAAPPRLRR